MFKQMRMTSRMADSERAFHILEKGEYGILSTTGENGYSYGVPLNYVCYDGNIYFHCAKEGAKIDNINYNNKVSFCVVGATQPAPEKFSFRYESAIVFGKCSLVNDDQAKKDILLEIIKKYSPDFIEKGKEYIERSSQHAKVIKLSIEHITAKASNI